MATDPVSLTAPLADRLEGRHLAAPPFQAFRPRYVYRQAIWLGRLVTNDREGRQTLAREHLLQRLNELTPEERVSYQRQLRAEANRAQFLRATDGKLSDAGVCVSRLLGRKCGQYTRRRGYYCDVHAPPYADHSVMLIRGGRARAYITQPYRDRLDAKAEAELRAFCAEHGLAVHLVPSLSWHHPPLDRVIWHLSWPGDPPGQELGLDRRPVGTTLVVIHRQGVPLRGHPDEPHPYAGRVRVRHQDDPRSRVAHGATRSFVEDVALAEQPASGPVVRSVRRTAMDSEELAAIRARAQAATPGPWIDLTTTYARRCNEERKESKRGWYHGSQRSSIPLVLIARDNYQGKPIDVDRLPVAPDRYDLTKVISLFWDALPKRQTMAMEGFFRPEDAAFVTHARQDVEDLLDEVERLRSRVAELEQGRD